MLRRHTTLVVACLLGGCGVGETTPIIRTRGSCPGDGVLSIAWTIRGATPTATSCQGIDHISLDLVLDGCNGSVTIAPIPCALDKFRYDHLPEGNGTVSLQGLDAVGQVVIQGQAAVTIAPAVPSTPTPVPLGP